MYFAHSGPTRERWEPLADHLRDVAERAASFATPFGAADEARAAGLLHDLGKYSDLFTLRLEGREKGLDHWSPGAWAAFLRYRELGVALALAIQGHHIGLQKGDKTSLGRINPAQLQKLHPLGLRLTDPDPERLRRRLEADGLALPDLERSLYDPKGLAGAGMLDVRMLFSALVDADFLETEAHFERFPDGAKSHRPEAPGLQPGEALARLEEKVADLARSAQAASEVLSLRADLFQACLDAAARPPGLFTLSAPTGAGKTLAMLAFALRHAREHGLRRVVLAIPYLSILEQTVRVYRDLLEPLFGPSYLVEHHSLAGTRPQEAAGPERLDDQSEERRRARWQAENWDAPLVVTTSVQLLESLFASRPGACRKLHRLAGSVILLDEVQTLPPSLAVPTLAALSHLAGRYGSTVVFSTATQPAFDHLDARVRGLAAGGWRPREIVPAALGLFDRARRTRVAWDTEPPRTWESLADELAGRGSVLCIVNLKQHARELTEALRRREAAGLLHLSTNLCPAHREKVLAEVRRRLDAGEPCLLISTQCVEAGVDVDFPVVYRAFGPLDAIAQAAGRCNRNGRNGPKGEPGEVRVFRPEDERYPPGGYEKAAAVTGALLKSLGPDAMDIHSPGLFRLYYQELYNQTGITEGDEGKAKRLQDALLDRHFEEAARLYRLIDQDAVSVLVPYEADVFAALKKEVEETGFPTRAWIRRARPHAVSLFRPKPGAPVTAYLQPAARAGAEGDRRRSEEWFLYLAPEHYDRELLGLMEAEEVWIA